MPLVNYEGDSSDEEESQTSSAAVTTRRLHLPAPSRTTATPLNDEIVDDDDDESMDTSSGLLANLPKPQENSSVTTNATTVEFPESELEDIVRGENKDYAKQIPQLPKPIKRKRDGPVKIFLPTIEQDSDDEDKPKRKQPTSTRNCALLNALPAPMYDEDKPVAAVPIIKAPSANAPQVSSTGLFIPYALNKKKSSSKSNSSNTASTGLINDGNAENDEDDDEDDDANQTDFLGLTKSDQVQISTTDVESVLRETFPRARPTVIEQPVLLPAAADFEDLDQDDESNQQSGSHIDDDDELLRFLPKSERYKEIKHVHIDSMFGDSGRLQLLKNATEERETMLAQAAIQVPKGEQRRRAQITYLVAKAQSDDLRLKNMWSEQKLTKRQTQAKYGF